MLLLSCDLSLLSSDDAGLAVSPLATAVAIRADDLKPAAVDEVEDEVSFILLAVAADDDEQDTLLRVTRSESLACDSNLPVI